MWAFIIVVGLIIACAICGNLSHPNATWDDIHRMIGK
jgi:low affinity Fe/Cu permease